MSDPLAEMYRMPVVFGPAPGPRNLPQSQRHRRYDKQVTTLALSAGTDGAMLSGLLPEGFSAAGEPRLEIVVTLLADIGWLAGRGYNIVMVRIPARWQGEEEEVTGHFVPVVWENMADPILTGREELGWPKIFAEIPDPVVAGGTWHGHAAWCGYEFLLFDAGGFADAPPPAVRPQPMMFHKYMPRTGEWGSADIDQMTITPAGGQPPQLRSCRIGTGTFAFRSARWEDMPTQYPIVNALARLPLGDFGPAVLIESSGGSDVSEQRILR